MEERTKDTEVVDVEIQKSIQKIKKLFSYGMQQSSCASIPDEKVSSVSFETSFEPFHVHEKAKEAEEVFHKVLEEIMQENQLPRYIYKILEEQKEETALTLEQYDRIISELSQSLTEYNKEYKQKCEKHSVQHQLLEENIEDLISEINRIGKEEIQNIRMLQQDESKQQQTSLSEMNDLNDLPLAHEELQNNKYMIIIQNTRSKIDKHMEKCQKVLDETAADVPFDDYLWKPPTTMLPIEELIDTFSIPGDEVITKRREMLSKICDLRKDLERQKLDYALKLERLEKELFDVKENYKKKKMAFSKLKRKHTKLIARRDALCTELRGLETAIDREYEIQNKLFEKDREEKQMKSYLQQESNLKYNYVFKERSMEAYTLLSDIVNAANLIMEDVLGIKGCIYNLDNFRLNHKTILSYLVRKGYWYDFLHAAPNIALIDDVMKAVQDYWSQLKVSSRLSDEKRTLYLENKEVENFLKYYYQFEK